MHFHRFAMMFDDQDDDVILLDQPVYEAEDLVEAEEEIDDYQPTEEVILLDLMRVDESELELA